jgi:hypothetical protein
MKAIARSTKATSVNDLSPSLPPITCGDFAKLAKKKGWSAEFLAERFKGLIEKPSEFFHRCLSGSSSADVVIPYRSVINFYHQEANPFVREPFTRLCLCGCLRRLYGRKKYATAYCRKKACLERARNPKTNLKKGPENRDLSVTFFPAALGEVQGNTWAPHKPQNGQNSGGALAVCESLEAKADKSITASALGPKEYRPRNGGHKVLEPLNELGVSDAEEEDERTN